MVLPHPDAADDAHLHDWRAVYALSAGWALSFSVVTASITATNLASSAFSPSTSWNTVPLAILIVSLSAWSLALPSLFARLGGRLNTYRATSCVGVAASAIAAVACAAESFGALCVSSALFGLPAAAGQSFRFAVLTLVPPRSRPKCIGLVLTGGVVGAVLGPAYAAAAKDAVQDAPFAGVYLCTGVALALLLGIVCAPGLVTFPAEGGDAGDAGDDDAEAGRAADGEVASVASRFAYSGGAAGKPETPMRERIDPVAAASATALAAANVGFRCAVVVAALSYGAMSFLMSPTPLAMRARGFSFDTVSHVITAHMLGMYAPSFVTGKAVAARGWRPAAAAGAGLFVVAGAVMRDGHSVAHYAGGQLTLGVAWNLCFVAATAEVARVSMVASARAHPSGASARARSAQKVQAAADVATFAVAGAASVASGAALAATGWGDMQVVGWACAGAMLVAVGVSAVARDEATEKGAGSIEKEASPTGKEGRV